MVDKSQSRNVSIEKNLSTAVPFFVADRPMSLRILKGLPLLSHPSACVGIMAHANTTDNFHTAFRLYPCEKPDFCDAVGKPCEYIADMSLCPHRNHIRSHTIKMCDSGIFTREGATLTYEQLFKLYVKMDVEYGIMIDVLSDADATIESAQVAIQHYASYRDKFKLVGVAQGDSVESYLSCYERLKAMGFSYIAIGGLLKRKQNTVRFTEVANETFMREVMRAVRHKYPNDWLFALGCFHASRIEFLKESRVWADSKGWIFQYETRDITFGPLLEQFSSNHLEHTALPTNNPDILSVQKKIALRRKLMVRIEKTNKILQNGKRTIRNKLQDIMSRLLAIDTQAAKSFKSVVSFGLLDATDERKVTTALEVIGINPSNKEYSEVVQAIKTNRELKTSLNELNSKLARINKSLLKALRIYVSKYSQDEPESVEKAQEIIGLLTSTDQQYRIAQVRQYLTQKVVSVLR